MKFTQEIREIARALGNICTAVTEDKSHWGKIEDERIQRILALCGGCAVYRETLIEFCLQIEDLPHSPTETEFATYRMRADWHSSWKWFYSHPDAVCFTNRAIESNATPEDLAQFSFKLSRFITLALQKELDAICQAAKDYILEVYRG